MSDAINVGCRAIDVMDDVQGARVPVRVLYPTSAAARAESFGPYSMDLAVDAPVAGSQFPVVAVSHGKGGTPWSHRGLAENLVRGGFVVVLVEHPGNSRSDNSLDGRPANLANRPRHVRLALDAAFADAHVGPHVVAGRAAVIGHSFGGYTALATAGGRPMSLPHENADGVGQPVPVEPDARVAALVLFAPALPWLMAPGALAEVRAPLLVRTGERDEIIPPAVTERILAGLPADARMDYQAVPGAGHFAFISPPPTALASPSFPPSVDPPGFDRVAYQARLGDEVLAFLRASL